MHVYSLLKGSLTIEPKSPNNFKEYGKTWILIWIARQILYIFPIFHIQICLIHVTYPTFQLLNHTLLLMHFKNSSLYHFNKLLIHVKYSQKFWCDETTKSAGDGILAKQWTNLFKMIQTNVTQNNKNRPSRKHCEKMKFIRTHAWVWFD
jgi:hypothetical protein